LNRVQQSSITKRLISGTFWTVIGNGTGSGFKFIAMILVARILGTQLYGEYGLIKSVTDVFIVLSSFGLGTTATKHIAELLSNDKKRIGRIIGLCYLFTLVTCFISAIGLYLTAPLICNSSMLNAPHLVNEFRVSIVMLVFMTFSGTQIGIMAGFQDFRGLAYVNFISGLLAVPLYIIGTIYAGVTGAIIGMGIAAAANVLVNSIFIYYNTRQYKICYSFIDAWKEYSILWKLSFPLVLCGFIYIFFTVIFRMMLVASPNGFHELGIFVAVIQIETIMCYMSGQISSVSMPMFSELLGKKDIVKYQKLSYFILLLTIGIVSLFIVPMICMSRWVMSLFGNGFENGWLVLVIVCCGVIFRAGESLTCRQCISLNRMWEYSAAVIFILFMQLGLLYYFLKFGLGAVGMALAYSISYMFFFVATLIIISINKQKFIITK
jgi:O-antigen/teichoic acid export membrane protein